MRAVVSVHREWMSENSVVLYLLASEGSELARGAQGERDEETRDLQRYFAGR